ncbi:MAG: HlyD family efflux transporter periplasmic adaptor subunit [Rhodospirillaceae bacterium]
MAKKTPPQASAAAPTSRAAASPARAVAVEVRHPIKAATLLYSAPAFILRGPIYMMFVSMAAMLSYSFVATTDTVVSAPLTLQRQTVTIPAIGGGLVESLEVNENSQVTVGQAIGVVQEKIRAASTPEQEAIDRQLRDYEERKQSLRRDFEHNRRQVESQLAEQEGRLRTGKGSLEDRLGQLKNQLNTSERTRSNLMEDVRTAESNLGRIQPLCARRDIPVTQCEQASQRVSDLRRSANNAQSDIDNIKLSLLTAQREQAQQGDQGTLERMRADLTKAKSDYAEQDRQIDDRVKELVRRRLDAQTLVPGVRYSDDKAFYTSTVDGIVTTVHIQRGQLLQPGSPVVTIVKNSAPLEARVLVQNKDIGLLRIGQDVKIKYYAYPYQEYGIQTGSISDISVRPSTAPGETNLFVVNVALASETTRRQPIQAGDPVKTLEIGLTGAAEIKTGEKRFIELLFTPASKFFKAGPEDSGAASPDAGGSASPKS